jgi:glucokinase
MGYLAVDFGGTRTRAAWYTDELEMVKRSETPSQVNQPGDIVIRRILDIARAVVPEGEKPHAVGIAGPGPLDPTSGIIYYAHTLPGWKDVPLVNFLSLAFEKAPTFMQNDGNLAALAEYHLGAGRGADPMVYMTISTGIGGGAVIGGRLFTGGSGMAIEPGHLRFTLPDGSILRLEELASGTGLAWQALRRLENTDEPSSLREAGEVTGRAVGEAAQAGDALALAVVSEAGQWLGLGLANIVHLLNPQAIVLGGSVSGLGNLLLEPAMTVLKREALHPRFVPDNLLRKAALGDDVCLVGAALWAREQLQGQSGL